MITIKDVAAKARVSTTTVSHVINGTRYVSEDLIERVNHAIRELKYQPNALARSLRNKETGTIGMVTPDNSNPFFAEIARHIEDACFAQGYSVILCNSDQDPQKEQAYIRLLLEKQVDGIVFVAAAARAQSLREITERSIPMVVVDRELPGINADFVMTDHRRGGRLATMHLIERGIERGHTRIACIAGPSDVTPSWERVQGYRDALESAGLAYEESLIRRGNFQAPSGYSAMKELLTMSAEQLPTCVFACNDLMAIGAIRAISEVGLRVPEDVAVVGYDNISLSSFTNPPLTTVAQPHREMGRLAAELLLDRINDKAARIERRLLEPALIIRQSA